MSPISRLREFLRRAFRRHIPTVSAISVISTAEITEDLQGVELLKTSVMSLRIVYEIPTYVHMREA